MNIFTTSVGSLPKPAYLTEARTKFARGNLSKEQLSELELRATAHWIRIQEEIGLDVLVDGEMYRGDMVAFFAEEMDGFASSGLVRSYGNRYYRKPIAVGPVRRRSDITVGWWKYAQSLTNKPVKGMVTGPYTMVDWSFNEYYSTRSAFIIDMAKCINEEVLALQNAGAKYIQIDEPAISTRPDEMDVAIEAMNIATDGVKAITISHTMEYTRNYWDFAKIYDQLMSLPVDILDLETVNSNYSILELIKENGLPNDKSLSIGVVDSHDHRVESVEQIKSGIKASLAVIPPSRLSVKPDCGLKTRLENESIQKLRNVVTAALEVKREFNLES